MSREPPLPSPFVWSELTRALSTAATHEDELTRGRAAERSRSWLSAITAMVEGRVQVGSRRPVPDLPEWVTLEVLRGGFATGSPAASGPLTADERAVVAEFDLPADRGAVFAHHLSDVGLDRLGALLESRAYRVDVPEEAALLAAAWLIRNGHGEAAARLVEVMLPFAGTLRFGPRSAAPRREPAGHVHRVDAGVARERLAARRSSPAVEAQREALEVWAPFTDRVIALWEQLVVDGRLVEPGSVPGWADSAAALGSEYAELLRDHTRCGKARRPRENLALLVTAACELVLGVELTARRRGLILSRLQAASIARGEPGSARLAARRDDDARIWRAPSHADLARVAARRLADLAGDEGIAEPERVLAAVTVAEATDAIPAGIAMPPAVARIVARSVAAPVEELLDRGVVPSGEVLAELVPSLVSEVAGARYADPALAALMAAHHVAFSRRRSLLLRDLLSQIRIEELPWVRAVAPFAQVDLDLTVATVLRVGQLALDRFPGTVLPNPLVSELARLTRGSDVDMPWVEELAADIFAGRFSAKFAAAAELAAARLVGTLYGDYHDLDQVDAVPHEPAPRRADPEWGSTPADDDWFTTLCRRRASSAVAGAPAGSWVADNGTVIEQAQILTTHNLATLVELGVRPTRPWTALADDAWRTTRDLLSLAAQQERPLASVKNAAYAWRQTVFHLSMADRSDAVALADRFRADAAGSPTLEQVVGGLAHVLDGGRFDEQGRCPHGRRLLGWTVGPHWALDR